MTWPDDCPHRNNTHCAVLPGSESPWSRAQPICHPWFGIAGDPLCPADLGPWGEWRAVVNEITTFPCALGRNRFAHAHILLEATGWPVPPATPATRCDKQKLRKFLLKQKTAAFEQGMAAIAEGDERIFNAGYDIVHFLDWLIYLKLDNGMFDIEEDTS